MLRSLLFVALLAPNVLSILPIHYQFRDKLSNANRVTGNSDVAVTTAYLSQNLDHFVGNASGTFTQRYFYTQQFTLHQKTAFLFVSESGNFEKPFLTDETTPIVKSARQFGATIFALEHRFYGESKPNFTNFDAYALRSLNSFQAVRDVIHFIKFANAKFNFDPDVRWVLWGAGYGGIIAAEARKLDPVTVAGAISSSAPLRHEYDFYQFNDAIARTLMNTGGLLCYNKVKQGFSDIRTAMNSPEGRANVTAMFGLTPALANTSLGYNDIQMFYLSIISPFQQLTQFNNDFNMSIGDMCEMIDKSDWTPMQVVYQAYAYVSIMLYGYIPNLVSSYQAVIADLGNSNANSPLLDQRMFQYQMCTEFGWFTTTNNDEDGLFGPVVPTSLFLNICFDSFPDANLTPTSIRDLIVNYNNFYGAAQDYSGTNVVFTNGWYDPWSGLVKESTADFSVVAYIIPMASHAADFFPGDTNNTYIIQAHKLFNENINIWVNGPRNPKTFVNTTYPWTRPSWGEFGETGKTLLQVKTSVQEKFSALPEDVPSKRTYPAQPPQFKRMFLGRPPHKFLPDPEPMNAADYPPGFEQGTFRQRVDHFDNTNPNVFTQKFYKNTQWAKAGGPNFIMIGGEGPEGPYWVLNENLPWINLAKKYGATVYILEHRFYGDSMVGDNMDLSKLTSLQMLYDLAEFIRATNFLSGTSNPWITFGGSYSGALSAWMREVFPDVVIGAVASSAPVYAKTDFYEYLMVVENSARNYDPACAENIRAGFAAMQQLFLTKEGRQNLSDIFQLNPPFRDNVTDTDRHYFFSNIYGMFEGADQYSGDNIAGYADGHGVADMCRIMTNSSNSPLMNVVAFNEYMSIFYQGGGDYVGMDNDYQDLVDYLKNSQQFGPQAASALYWTWQTCTEFGYFQSADSGNGIFGSPVPVNMFIRMCEDVFGTYYTRATVDQYVSYTNYKYGERFHYRGSNVVLPNGNVDPWHALGLYAATDSSVVSYLIDGTAHCADMYAPRDSDKPGLKVARDLIDQNIAIWLGQATAAPVTTTVAPPVTGGSTGAPGSTVSPGSVGTGSTGSPSSSPTVTVNTTATVETTTRSASSATVLISVMSIIARYLV